MGLAKARMAIHARVKQEQEAFNVSVSKVKISGAKKQAQLMNISNTGQGTIKLEKEKPTEPLAKQVTPKISNFLKKWDDDLEDFE